MDRDAKGKPAGVHVHVSLCMCESLGISVPDNVATYFKQKSFQLQERIDVLHFSPLFPQLRYD